MNKPDYIAPRAAGTKQREIGTCEKCRWWVSDESITTVCGEDGNATEGMCHRYPPAHKSNFMFTFPVTLKGDFCGEFTPKGESECLKS